MQWSSNVVAANSLCVCVSVSWELKRLVLLQTRKCSFCFRRSMLHTLVSIRCSEVVAVKMWVQNAVGISDMLSKYVLH